MIFVYLSIFIYFVDLVHIFLLCIFNNWKRMPPQMTKNTASDVALCIDARSETSKGSFFPIIYKPRTGPMVLKVRMLTDLTYINGIPFAA